MRASTRLVLLLLLAVLGCQEPAYRIYATFTGPLEVEEGAEVRYQGVTIGSVEEVSLYQKSPEAPALVVLTIAITSSDVTIREGDDFTIETAGLLGDEYLSIRAARKESPPLPPGATVEGTPSLTTRFFESVASAVEWFDGLSEEKREAFVESPPQRAESTPSPPKQDPEPTIGLTPRGD